MRARFAGLLSPEGAGSPAERRRALLALDDTALTEAVVRLALALREVPAEALAAVADVAGLPLGEVVASPFGLRAVALATGLGATTLAHELRVPIEWPAAWRAGEAVADEGHATWDRGVLQTGKYQAFLQDEPLATYNPAHMSKWGPHELTHRAAGFFWRADTTHWELYLGARLNELVPVVLWYGPDEVLRLDRDGFDRERDRADPEASPERARWLTEPVAALRERARRTARFLRDGLEHFERELGAIDQELEGGRQVSVPHPFLDAASDAAAYVVGHVHRLSSPTTTALVEGLLTPGLEYEDSVPAYRARVEALLDDLLFAELAWSLESCGSRSAGRRLWDWLTRVAQCGPDYFEAVAPWLPEARQALEAAAAGTPPDLRAWARRLVDELDDPDPIAAGALDAGAERQLRQLLDGLESVTPATTRLLDRLGGLEEWLLGFVGSPHFRRRQPLAARVADFMAETEAPALVTELLRFELALLRATARDDQVERLSPAADALPADFSSGRLVASAAFAVYHFDHDVAALHAVMVEDRLLAELPTPEASTYLIGRLFDELVVVPAPLGLPALWERLREGATPVAEARAILAEVEPPARPGSWPENAQGWIEELIGAGAVGWVPRVAGLE